jgi:acylpyruvate hydrolase
MVALTRFSTDGTDDLVGVVDGREVAPLGSWREFFRPGFGFDTAMLEPPRRTRLAPSIPLGDVKLLPPVQPAKIVGIGGNYLEHLHQAGIFEVDPVPTMFSIMPNALASHGSDILLTPFTKELDYEAELAVVIGRHTKSVAEDAALGSVFGYACANDVSARDWQVGKNNWVFGKSADTFFPIGPVLVTADSIDDPQNLMIRSYVNGECRQDASTSDMIHSVAKIISLISDAVTLEPGDVISTGTPGGVGRFRKKLLENGDVIDIDISGIGRLSNTVRSLP